MRPWAFAQRNRLLLFYFGENIPKIGVYVIRCTFILYEKLIFYNSILKRNCVKRVITDRKSLAESPWRGWILFLSQINASPNKAERIYVKSVKIALFATIVKT